MSIKLLAELALVGTSICVFLCFRVFLQRVLYSDIQFLVPAIKDSSLPQSVTVPRSGSQRSWHSVLAQSSFSICFTECCMLYAMLLCQGFNLLDPHVRLYTWKTSIFLLLLTIIIFIPASFCTVLAYRSENPRLFNMRAIAILLPVTLFVFILSFVPLPVEFASNNPLTLTAARLVVLGTIILGLLSGLGAVNGAWGIFARGTNFTTQPFGVAQELFPPLLQSLRRRMRLSGYGVTYVNALAISMYMGLPRARARGYPAWLPNAAHVGFHTSWFMYWTEIIGLEALESQMTTRVAALKRNRENTEFALSIRGKILSRIWAVYCVCRVFSSIMNLLSPPASVNDKTSSYGDIIAHVFAYLFSLLPAASGKPPLNVPSLSRQISLALVGAIILSSVRTVLRGVTGVFRITSRNISASLMLILLAQLMGIYLLTTLVQLRTMFPPPSSFGLDRGSEGDTNLFSSLPQYSLFGGLFDWSFLFGAMGCVLARWTGRLFGGGDDDYA